MHATEAIILRSRTLGEADALLSVFTRDFGKMLIRAQGVKKEGAKLRGHTEVLSHSLIRFVIGRGGERLTHAEMLNSWPTLRAEREGLAAALSICDLVDRYHFPGEPDSPLWNLLIKTLNEMNVREHSREELAHITKKFESEFLAGAGFSGASDRRVLDEYMVERPQDVLY